MNFRDLASKGSVSYEDGRSDMHRLRQRFVGASDLLSVTLNCVISANLKLLTGSKLNWLVISQHASSDLRSFGVKHDADLFVGSLFECLLQVLNTLSVGLVITMREVQSCNVHASVNHLDEHINIPTRWSKTKKNKSKFGSCTYPSVQTTLVFLSSGSICSKIC